MEERLKQLLLQDLCARLPYDIICEVFDPQQEYEEDVFNAHLIQIDAWTSHCYFWGCSETDPYDIEQVKPYLRSMSSMTEEEWKEYKVIDDRSYSCPMDYAHIPASDRIDWLLAHHFDFRNLIKRGLALEAPKGMYNS
jgi:hypothetical protein